MQSAQLNIQVKLNFELCSSRIYVAHLLSHLESQLPSHFICHREDRRTRSLHNWHKGCQKFFSNRSGLLIC